MILKKNIGGLMGAYHNDILADIGRLIGIQSFRTSAKPGKPFGDGPAEALGFCLELGRKFGLKVENIGNYAGHVEYGEGDGLVGVLCHVDTVPVGEGWTFPPFSPTLKDGRLYGRGAMDDKSQAITAIYCLKALKDAGVKTGRRIRVILGAGEETGMEDLKHYFSSETVPDFSFSPDSEYPVCNTEKGIMQIKISGGACGGKILSFEAGEAANAVPVSARAVLEPGSVLPKANEKIRVSEENGALTVCLTGRAAHGSEPQKGENAALRLIHALSADGGPAPKEGFFAFIDACLSPDCDGSSLGIACRDEESGALTVNPGVVRFSGGEGEMILDVRYPVTVPHEEVLEKIARRAAGFGLKAELSMHEPPLRVDAQSPLVKTLCEAYEIVTGQKVGVYSTGGGTYARALKNRGVAFGSGFKSLSCYRIHGADEFLEVSELKTHGAICLQAMAMLSLVKK